MSTSSGELHPLLACAHTVGGALKDVAHVDPGFMSVVDKKTALLELDRQIARLTELQLRVLGCADDVAAEEGMRDAGVWLAHHARLDRTDAARRLRLARDLHRYPPPRARCATGPRTSRKSQ